MKKILIAISLFLLIGGLSSCSGSDNEIDFEAKVYEMSTLLTTSGYVLEKQGYASKLDYTTKEIENRFGIELFIFELYIGYINTNEREVFLVAFMTSEDATLYEDNLRNEEDMDDRLVLREGQVVIITYSQETIDIF